MTKISEDRLRELAEEYGDMAGKLTGELQDGPGAASAFYMSASLGEVASIALELLSLRTSPPPSGEAGEVVEPIRYVTLGLGEWVVGTYLHDDMPAICFGPAPEPKAPGEKPTEEVAKYATFNGAVVLSFANASAATGMLDLVKEAMDRKRYALPTIKEPTDE
jgi:hypothetical protein